MSRMNEIFEKIQLECTDYCFQRRKRLFDVTSRDRIKDWNFAMKYRAFAIRGVNGLRCQRKIRSVRCYLQYQRIYNIECVTSA